MSFCQKACPPLADIETWYWELTFWFDTVSYFASLPRNLPLVVDYTLFIIIINTNEIPGKLSRKNMISSDVKITCYLHTWNDHCCYGYMINRAFCNDLVFYWCLYNKQNITWPLGDTKFLFSCWKIFHLFAVLTREIFFNTWREILYLHAVM